MGGPVRVRNISSGPVRAPGALALLDVVVGAASSSAAAARPLGQRLAGLARPVTTLVLRPPVVSPRFQPITWLTGLAQVGEERRAELLDTLSELLDELVPVVAQEVLRRMDLTGVVQRWVDLDAVVAGVDLDAVARRLDVDAVIARLDLTKIVQEQVDLDAVVAGVDLDAVAARLDLDAVIKRLDLAGLAEDVIAEVDLPDIIRGSTGSMASDTVTGVRMQSISGDQALARAVERLRLRRGRREAADGGPGRTMRTDEEAASTRPGATERP